MTDRNLVLSRLKEGLSQAFGHRFRGIVLFGSEARGDARPDSDIDVLVLLAERASLMEDLEKIINVTYPLEEELTDFRPIDATPVDFQSFEAQEYPLYQNAKREGIRI